MRPPCRDLALALAVAVIGAPTLGHAATVITPPDWIERPTSDDVAAAYPPDAIDKNLEGAATIGCTVLADGHLADCQIVKETPEGAGFGPAALALMPRFRMAATRPDGTPAEGGVVRLPIRFALPEAEVAPDGASVVSSVTVTPSAPPRPTIGTPHWIRRPSGAEFTRAYPRTAMRRGLSGAARLGCTVDDQGRMRDCEVLEETPEGGGFGLAALDLAPFFQMSKTADNGNSTAGGRVIIPIIFRAP